ncbi:hypothetical protein DYB34_008694 [Aphanomyces astaci]|uniref:HAT C-terminal dimerisation domain-containing protein n=1 Tax=Aphanomyces astaci TaxID=112090 RepID=A0A3R7DP79_APHAT|nr:hypothetical protein DYB34_008694 [Aphanomyces astaci]
MITNHATVIDKVNALMTKLRFTLPAARLRHVTPLRAITLSATRWSSTFNMLKRYIELKPFLLAIADDSIDVLRLNVVEDREVTALLVTLEDLNSITLALQGDESSLLEVRQIFDTVIEDYPDAVGRLGPSARVVKNPCFESAIVKILHGTETTMTAEECESVIKLRNEETIESSAAAVAPSVMYLAERALKKKKVTRVTSGFLDCRFLCPTSNMCERFFSSTKLAIGDRRCSMTPKNFEEQMFLHANINLWTIEDVQEMMRSVE